MVSSLGQLALLAVLWPILLGLRLFQWAERGVAVVLGVYFGLLQGGAFAAAAIAHLLLSRGGLSRLVWGAGAHRLAARAMSVPVPGTPPRRTDALRAADRLPSDVLPAIGAIAPAAALQHAAPAEPAVPHPITPPPVATASSLPSEATPLLAPVTEEAEAEGGSAGPAPSVAEAAPAPAEVAPAPAEAAPATAEAAPAPAEAAPGPAEAAPATPAQPAPQQAAPPPSPPPQQPAEHPVIDAALVRAIARSDAPYGPPSLEGAVEEWEADLAAHAGGEREAGAAGGARPARSAGPSPARRLEDLKAREEQLLAAFEPAGPEALQAAAAWLSATEPSPSMGGNGLTLPAEYTAPSGRELQAGAGGEGPTALGYQALPQRPPEEGGKQAPAAAEPAGPAEDAAPPSAPAASPARPPRPLVSASSGRMSVASRGSGRSGSALSFDRMASHPLPDLDLDEEEGGSRLAGAASSGPTIGAGPFASTPAGALDSRTAGGLQAAAAEAAAYAVHAAVTEAAAPGAAGLEPLGVDSAFSGGDMDTAGLTADDSMDITRHTKREKR